MLRNVKDTTVMARKHDALLPVPQSWRRSRCQITAGTPWASSIDGIEQPKLQGIPLLGIDTRHELACGDLLSHETGLLPF